jgi:hypothetical protein
MDAIVNLIDLACVCSIEFIHCRFSGSALGMGGACFAGDPAVPT